MEIKTVSLINQLESVKKGLTAKETIQQSDCFVFKDGYVYTFNDEIFATCETDLDLEGAVKAESLLKLLNKVKDENIDVEIDDDELKISGKKFSTGIKLESEILLPTDEIELPESFEDVPENFSYLAKLACLTASKSLNMALLTCVHLEGDKIESCDNDRITICRLEEEFDHDVLIPAKNLATIVKENIVGISVDDSWAHFKTDENVILSCRLLSSEDDEYVDLEEHIPEEKDGREINFPTEIEEIISRASIFGEDEESGDNFAHISLKKGKLNIAAQNETGWYTESTKVNSKENLSFSINTDFLRDVTKMTNKVSIVDDTLVFSDDSSIHLVKLEE